MSLMQKIFSSGENFAAVDVTPELAKVIIDHGNYENRKIRPLVVKKYAKAMLDGDWRYSPETISIADNGRLLNGQHRLLAVIESGVTCKFLFATGFDEEVFKVLDRGTARSAADALKMDKKLAEVGALLARIQYGGYTRLVTDQDIERAAMRVKAGHDLLIEHAGSCRRLFSSAPFRLAAVARVMGGCDLETVYGLYRDLVLANTHEIPPVGHAVMKAFLNGKLVSGGGGSTQMLNLCVAWDVFNPKSAAKTKLYVVYRAESLAEIGKATGYE